MNPEPIGWEEMHPATRLWWAVRQGWPVGSLSDYPPDITDGAEYLLLKVGDGELGQMRQDVEKLHAEIRQQVTVQ